MVGGNCQFYTPCNKYVPVFSHVTLIKYYYYYYNDFYHDSCQNFDHKYYPARERSARARRAHALRALGLLLADGALTVGWGKTFWGIGRVPSRKRA